MEFDGYWNLMTHRKNAHPSNKKCRNFPGNCNFGSECWYAHDEAMDTDHAQDTEKGVIFKCNMCEEIFKQNSDFMKHKRSKHTGSNRNCDKFNKGQCERSADDCWYPHNHQSKDTSQTQNKVPKEQVFHQAPAETLPPDQLSKMFWMMNNLCRKVEGMEKRFEELMI